MQPFWDNIMDNIADNFSLEEYFQQDVFRRDSFWDALDAWRNATQNGIIDPEERNNHLRKVSKFLFRAGIGIAGTSMTTLISDQPTDSRRRAIFSDVVPHCFLFFAGSAGMSVGWLLISCNNPSRYSYLAKLAMLPLAFGYVCKIFG